MYVALRRRLCTWPSSAGPQIRSRQGDMQNRPSLPGTEETEQRPSLNKVLFTQSCPTLETPWIGARQATLSTESSRQEYWSGLPFPSPGDLSSPGTEPRSPALQTHSLPSKPPGKFREGESNTKETPLLPQTLSSAM